MSDFFLYTQKKTSCFHFLKNTVLYKNIFHLFKGRLETSLLWDFIWVYERIRKSNSWASSRVSLYQAWRAVSVKAPGEILATLRSPPRGWFALPLLKLRDSHIYYYCGFSFPLPHLTRADFVFYPAPSRALPSRGPVFFTHSHPINW